MWNLALVFIKQREKDEKESEMGKAGSPCQALVEQRPNRLEKSSFGGEIPGLWRTAAHSRGKL